MHVLHQADPRCTKTIIAGGLKRTSRGEKGNDKAIIKTDHYLDSVRPESHKEQDISRDDNLYAYVCTDTIVIDITDGTHRQKDLFIQESEPTLFQLAVDPARAYVSDLDTYDSLKAAIERDEPESMLEPLAYAYWDSVIRLDRFTLYDIPRPEVMITYDIPPSDIKLIK